MWGLGGVATKLMVALEGCRPPTSPRAGESMSAAAPCFRAAAVASSSPSASSTHERTTNNIKHMPTQKPEEWMGQTNWCASPQSTTPASRAPSSALHHRRHQGVPLRRGIYLSGR